MTTIQRLSLIAMIAGALCLSTAAPAEQRPLGLPSLPDMPGEDRVSLGARLFFDPLLSVDGTTSCSTCHLPEQAFTQNGAATALGLDGQPLRRNAPTLLNVGYRQRLFHDGRESDLGQQAFSPLLAANEMGNRDLQQVVARLEQDQHYPAAFASAYAEGLTPATLGQALADFQRTLISADAPFDRWYYGGDTGALSAEAKAGFFVFSSAGCGDCHRFGHDAAQFTDDELHRTGVTGADTGLEAVTGRPSDRYRFRTPTLRNVALTAPYMHDGSQATLKDVVTFYGAGGGLIAGDRALAPLGLSDEEVDALVAFLESLNGTRPAIPGGKGRQPMDPADDR